MKEKIERARPYVWGGVIGIVGAAVVAFAAGFVTLTSTAESRIAAAAEDARVTALAGVCAEQAMVHRQEMGDTSELAGWRNRQLREDLAARFVPALGNGGPEPALVRACARLIEQRV